MKVAKPFIIRKSTLVTYATVIIHYEHLFNTESVHGHCRMCYNHIVYGELTVKWYMGERKAIALASQCLRLIYFIVGIRGCSGKTIPRATRGVEPAVQPTRCLLSAIAAYSRQILPLYTFVATVNSTHYLVSVLSDHGTTVECNVRGRINHGPCRCSVKLG